MRMRVGSIGLPMPSVRRRCWAVLVLFAIVAGAAGEPAVAQAERKNYLEHADIGYVVPPPPDNNSAIGEMDLAAVRAAQNTSPEQRTQAFDDAGAYFYYQLLPSFSEAAGTTLSLRTRPIMAHMLSWVLDDVTIYVTDAKNQKDRARPYLENPGIVACKTDFLRATDKQSYPSGHAGNGYAAALLLAEIMPERRQPLLARGIRYGDNRVICGVHHPIDVEQGRLIAIAYFDRVVTNANFVSDLACAAEEHRNSIAVRAGARPAWSTMCAMLFKRYQAEAKDKAGKVEVDAASFDPG